MQIEQFKNDKQKNASKKNLQPSKICAMNEEHGDIEDLS